MSKDNQGYGTMQNPSSEWYTPLDYLARVEQVLEYYQDICPIGGSGGLTREWCDRVYCNPPTPAKPWLEKAIQLIEDNPSRSILFAAFSPNVLYQVPMPMNIVPLACDVRKRIKWDSPNGNKSSPVAHNTFLLFSNDSDIKRRFVEVFSPVGAIYERRRIA